MKNIVFTQKKRIDQHLVTYEELTKRYIRHSEFLTIGAVLGGKTMQLHSFPPLKKGVRGIFL
jgi:hypothetical protein